METRIKDWEKHLEFRIIETCWVKLEVPDRHWAYSPRDRDKKGYLEDRRPASNMDPYLVIAKIAETTLL
jgi:glutamine synthetase